jgi:hypothetical protein
MDQHLLNRYIQLLDVELSIRNPRVDEVNHTRCRTLGQILWNDLRLEIDETDFSTDDDA